MTRVVLLIKDFDLAKTRLSSVLDPASRRVIATDFALAALAAVGPRALVVAGSETPAQVARGMGNQGVVEERAGGQNPAARLGIATALESGAEAGMGLPPHLPPIDAGVGHRPLAW